MFDAEEFTREFNATGSVVLRGVLNLAADELPRDLARGATESALQGPALGGLLV